MMLHLFAVAGLDHAIVVTPNDEGSPARVGRARAGPHHRLARPDWWEDLGKAIEVNAAELAEEPEELKLLICAHDGHPTMPMWRRRPAGDTEAEWRSSVLELIWMPVAPRRCRASSARAGSSSAARPRSCPGGWG